MKQQYHILPVLANISKRKVVKEIFNLKGELSITSR